MSDLNLQHLVEKSRIAPSYSGVESYTEGLLGLHSVAVDSVPVDIEPLGVIGGGALLTASLGSILSMPQEVATVTALIAETGPFVTSALPAGVGLISLAYAWYTAKDRNLQETIALSQKLDEALKAQPQLKEQVLDVLKRVDQAILKELDTTEVFKKSQMANSAEELSAAIEYVKFNLAAEYVKHELYPNYLKGIEKHELMTEKELMKYVHLLDEYANFRRADEEQRLELRKEYENSGRLDIYEKFRLAEKHSNLIETENTYLSLPELRRFTDAREILLKDLQSGKLNEYLNDLQSYPYVLKEESVTEMR